MLIQPVVQAIFSPFGGKLSDKVEPRIVASSGMILTVTGLAMVTLLGEAASLNLVAASLSF
jgi:hypothetical protein